jgi:hypothetical protein
MTLLVPAAAVSSESQPSNESKTAQQSAVHISSQSDSQLTAHGRHGPELLPKDQLAAEVAAQKRIATFFHDKVTPGLRDCWAPLKGAGDIQMEYTFARHDKAWVPQQVILAHSTLAEDQNDAALKCMEVAVKGAPLSIDAKDTDTNEFFISWSWPVPMPKDSEEKYQLMLRSAGGGGGWGCDGLGTPARCKRCVSSGASSCCKTVCVGYKTCSFITKDGKRIGCVNDPPTQCVTGGSGGGVSGGIAIF